MPLDDAMDRRTVGTLRLWLGVEDGWEGLGLVGRWTVGNVIVVNNGLATICSDDDVLLSIIKHAKKRTVLETTPPPMLPLR